MKATMSALALTCLTFSAVAAQQTIRPFLWQAGMARSEVGEIRGVSSAENFNAVLTTVTQNQPVDPVIFARPAP